MCENKCEICNADIVLEYDEEDNAVYRCSYCGNVVEKDGEIYHGL